MRQIKFRYVYQNVDTNEIKIAIKDIVQIEKNNEPYLDGWVLVSRDEFTGLTDKNGKEIYEGDIIEDKNGIGVIMWFQTAWGIASYAYGYNGLKSYTAVDSFYSKETKEWTVISSIHDNPSLLTNKE